MPKVSEEHLIQRRRQILDAAITCFARKGFSETTMAEIAAEAGVSDTLAYRYFRSKDEIIDAAVGEWKESSIVSTDGVEDLRGLLGRLVAQNIRRFEDLDAMKATMNVHFRSWAEAVHNEDLRGEVLERWRHHVQVVEGLVSRAQEQGQVSPSLDSRALARVMLGTHYGLNLQAVLDPQIDLKTCSEVMVSVIFGESAVDVADQERS